MDRIKMVSNPNWIVLSKEIKMKEFINLRFDVQIMNMGYNSELILGIMDSTLLNNSRSYHDPMKGGIYLKLSRTYGNKLEITYSDYKNFQYHNNEILQNESNIINSSLIFTAERMYFALNGKCNNKYCVLEAN